MRAPWKRRGKREEDDRPAVVIGTQMAAAIEAEKRHQSVPRDASPLADIRYDPSRGELDLFRFSESPTDQIIGAEVESVFVAGVDAIAQLRAALTQGDLYTLLTFSRRQALLALRQESADAVTVGFRSLVLVDLERIDWRDGAVAAGLLAYAGRRVGVPVRDLVSEIITRAEQRMADVLSRHSAAPAEGLAVGGYREVRTSQGVGLAQDHGHSYAPSVDLISIAERVIALIERDEYRVDNLTTGSDLPAVWLPGADAEAAKAREGLRGCLPYRPAPRTTRAECRTICSPCGSLKPQPRTRQRQSPLRPSRKLVQTSRFLESHPAPRVLSWSRGRSSKASHRSKT